MNYGKLYIKVSNVRYERVRGVRVNGCVNKACVYEFLRMSMRMYECVCVFDFNKYVSFGAGTGLPGSQRV